MTELEKVYEKWSKELGDECIIRPDAHDLAKRVYAAIMEYARGKAFEIIGSNGIRRNCAIELSDLESFGKEGGE